jgi:hypothetical protein
VVLEERLAEGGYGEAARRLAAFRGGEVTGWDGEWPALERLLREQRPRYLALVLAPGSIDANLPRRLVPVLAALDDDPFVDCAFGLITGATGEDALRFVDAIVRAPEGELPARKLEAVSVVMDRCTYLPPRAGTGKVRRPLETTSLWVTGRDEGWRDFLAGHRGEAAGCGLVEWGHCGDSQGIWLFSMYRNMERDKHWRYAPDRVGEDPEGEMPRMTPMSLLEGIDLFPAVVVNGSCHSGVTRDTVVGGDIVSTFGDTGGVVRLHPITPEESFPLMALRHGATAYIAPLAANNANRAAIEEWMIVRGGVPLGEVMKRTYDELVLGSARGELAFQLFAEGADEPREAPMFHDTVHRVLFGDPAFVAWDDVVPTTHEVTLTREGSKLLVDVRWRDLRGDPWVWDPWLERRDPRGERGRLYERIPLESAPQGPPRVTVLEAEVRLEEGWKPVELEPLALLETGFDGEPILHLKASGARADLCPLEGEAPTELHAVLELQL